MLIPFLDNFNIASPAYLIIFIHPPFHAKNCILYIHTNMGPRNHFLKESLFKH